MPHIGPEAKVGRRPNHGNHQRNQQGRRKIGQGYVTYRPCQRAAQFLRNDTCSGRRRAYYTEHGALQQYTNLSFRVDFGNSGKSQKYQHLECQRRDVPAVEAEVVRGNLYELEEQQEGNHHPLPFGGDIVKDMARRMHERLGAIQEIHAHTENYSTRKHPILNDAISLAHCGHKDNKVFLFENNMFIFARVLAT